MTKNTRDIVEIEADDATRMRLAKAAADFEHRGVTPRPVKPYRIIHTGMGWAAIRQYPDQSAGFVLASGLATSDAAMREIAMHLDPGVYHG